MKPAATRVPIAAPPAKRITRCNTPPPPRLVRRGVCSSRRGCTTPSSDDRCPNPPYIGNNQRSACVYVFWWSFGEEVLMLCQNDPLQMLARITTGSRQSRMRRGLRAISSSSRAAISFAGCLFVWRLVVFGFSAARHPRGLRPRPKTGCYKFDQAEVVRAPNSPWIVTDSHSTGALVGA